MSNNTQSRKNIKLTQKLAEYLVEHGVEGMPKNASFVPFSAKDKELNAANKKLLKSLRHEKKPVIKAQEPSTSKGQWTFTPLTFA